jgi:hypothetical protein
MSKYLKIFTLVILLIGITACTFYGKSDKQNMYAENPRLITPRDLSNFKTENYYPIPKLPETAKKMHPIKSSELIYPPGSK